MIFQDVYFLYHRYRGNGTSDEIARAASFSGDQECTLPGCSISLENGNLTIASLPLDYEGWYTFRSSGNLHYVEVFVNGRLFSVATLNINNG